jgi:TPR repeat protein
MKKIVLCLTLAFASLAQADELADANALLQKKAYPQALQLYTKLANAGNAEAQLQLGQMYWYGEAGSIDLVKADAWLKKSAAKGNKTAAASLEVMKQRELRRADIDYWVSKYDGADLKAGKFHCPAPRIPAVSKVNDEINRIAAAMTAWQDCYNAFVVNLNASAPLTKRIPDDISKLLNKQELETATAYLGELHTRMGADASISAKLLLADFDAWRAATDKFVKEHNELVKSMPAVIPKRKYDN